MRAIRNSGRLQTARRTDDCRTHALSEPLNREKLSNAIGFNRSDPPGSRDKFRELADLVQTPTRTIAAFKQQPVRAIGQFESPVADHRSVNRRGDPDDAAADS